MSKKIVLLFSIMFLLGLTSVILADTAMFTEDFGVSSFDKSRWIETYEGGSVNWWEGSTNPRIGTTGYSARLHNQYDTRLTMANAINTTGATEIDITFWARRDSSGGTHYLNISFNDNADASTFDLYGTYTPTSNTWVQQTVTLTDSKYMFNGFKVQLGGRAKLSGEDRSIYFDDVIVTAKFPAVISGSVGSLDGVTMSGLPGNPVTSGGGAYSATVNYGWSGTVTPSKTGYTFSPTNKTYSNVTSNQTAQNYTPTLLTYTISGTVGTVDGVTMGGLPGNPVTSGGGNYTATVDYGWTGTVTPSKAGYTFSPTNKTYSNVTSNQTAQNYTPTLLTYTISGTVGTLDGVTMGGLPGNPVTSGGGNYSATVGYGWTGTVTPSKAGYTFSPTNKTYSNVTANQTAQSYTPTLLTYTISGAVGTLDGVTMSGLPGNPVTSGGGAYSATVGYGWTGTVTPSKAGYTFSPTNKTYSNVTLNQTAQNYTPTLLTYTISGTVTDIDSVYEMSNVTMSGLPGNPATDTNGNYTVTVNYGWTGTVIPAKTGFTFSPVNKTYSNVTANKNDSYNATVIRFSISGHTGTMEGVVVDMPGQPVTDQSGYYTCQVDYGWSGGATPQMDGYTFQPSERLYENVTSNFTVQDYTPTINTYTISGYVGIVQDVQMTGLPGTPTTDQSGFYIGTVEYGWTGTVTPTKANIVFDPSQREYSDVMGDQDDQNYESIANTDLVGWWPLNGDANDYSGFGNNGAVTGAEFVFSEGKGTVLDFEGADYVSIPAAAFSSISNEITISLWQFGDAAVQPQVDSCFFGVNSSGTRVLNAHIPWSDGKIVWDAGCSGTSYDRMSIAADSANQYEGQWNHWVFTKNTSTGQMKIYNEGVLWQSATGKTRPMTGITQFKIGSKYDGTTNYDGMISDFRVYDRVLSDTEIYGLYIASYPASNPYPADRAVNVPINTVLNWSAGYLAAGVDGHDVYFGTSWADVNEANSLVHIGLQSGTTFDPGILQSGTTYFWKVDEVNDVYENSPWKGQIWSFTTVDSDLIGWWPLNGNANDYSGFGNNGTITGAESVYSSGKGTVLDFEGADYVSIPAAAFNSVSDKVSIALWQYGDTVLQPQDDSIFYAANSSGYRVIQSNLPWGSGTVYFDAGNVGSSYDRMSKSASPSEYEGKWNHWVFTKDSTTGQMNMYLNGSLWSSASGKTRLMTGITQFKIGAKYDGTSNYDGMVCDFRLYKKVLSQTEITNLFEGEQVYKATNPFPAEGTQNVPADIVLSWTPGYSAADVGGHDVYFGTNFDDVNAGIAAVHMGLQSDTTFNPGVLDYNTTYYWAVDEVNNVYEESPWTGNVWSFKTLTENDLPVMPTDVKNYNTQLMLGKIKGVVFPINWPTVGCDYTLSQCISGAQTLADSYHTWSRGKVTMVNPDNTGSRYYVYDPANCAVPYTKKSTNESPAQQYLIDQYNIADSTIKWFIQSGNSTSNAGVTTCDTMTATNKFTISHEMGHLFRLGHACLIRYNPDGTFLENYRYGDTTSNMGKNSGGFNLPGLHRLGWIDEDELAVFKREDSGTVYRIRENHLYQDVNLAGVVYYLPHTGNRLWIALTKYSDHGDGYLGSDYALTKYVTGWQNSSNMEETICITQRCGQHTDDFGLTYELVQLNTTEQWADIRITYNPADEKRTQPLVFNQTQRLLTAPASGVKGEMEVTISITNPNPDTTIPFINQKDKLTVANSYSVTEQTGLTNVLPGGTTNTAVFVVKSKTGPLSSNDAHLTGSFLVAHRLPFTFAINFDQ